ncbi:MAG: acetyltransferase [Gemmatimonadota bacterium]
MSAPIVLYGASELGRDAVSVFHALERAGSPRRVLGFVDDGADKQGRSFLDVPVLGTGAWLEGRAGDVEVLLTVGDPRVRRRIAERLTPEGYRWATLIHPSVVLTPWVEVGEGTLVMAGCTFTVEIQVGRHVVLNPGCTVAHDVRVGAYAYLSPGVNLAGRVVVGDGAFLGVGASVIPSRTVGAGAFVGAGAVVTKDVPPDRVAAGVPARSLKPVDVPWAR